MSEKLPVAGCRLPASNALCPRMRCARAFIRPFNPGRAHSGNCQATTGHGPLASAGPAHGGFTLTEVMFAVILLGIGFIMVAAMFPVAIQQSRTTTEETAASVIARAAMAHIAQVAQAPRTGSQPFEGTMPAAQGLATLDDPFWRAIHGAMIDQSDPRYAWTALYKRSSQSTTAQVYIFVLQARNRPTFGLNDIIRPTEAPPSNVVYPASIEPKLVHIRVEQGTPADRILVLDAAGDPMPAAAEGAYVITRAGSHVFRLGNPVNRSTGVWELAPGNDLPDRENNIPASASDPPVEAYMVGRGYHPDTGNAGLTGPPTFEGPAMDIAVFTGFVQVR